MAILGSIIARSLNIRKSLALNRAEPIVYQIRTLQKLVERAQYTSFGKHYNFEKMLLSAEALHETFREQIPISDYNEIFRSWWHRLLDGEENVTWPGKVKYFALSSGTSESSSKHIPVTDDMIKSIKKVGFKQFYSLTNFEIPSTVFTKGVLMLGGSTSLQETKDYFEGDMSGISAKNIPKLFSNIYYKPGQKISSAPHWEDRIAMIVDNAPNWDVGTLCGVPAWAQIVLEKILERYQLNNIHEIWPNLGVYIHGGVAFEPYKEWFQKKMGKPITYIETYMASEGSFGFRARPKAKGIKLVLNAGVFFEFLPFNEENFDEDGNLINPKAKTLLINEVSSRTPYAVVLTTCSGAWRYLIGDVVEFSHVKHGEIIIAGRTKQFLSICGEHTSVDNLNTAIEKVTAEYDLKIGNYTVAGFRQENTFAHHWYIGTDRFDLDIDALKETLDSTLKSINDDYSVERESALKNLEVTLLPEELFNDFLKNQGKYGAMNKFPRVLKGKQLEDWWSFLKKNNISSPLSTTTAIFK